MMSSERQTAATLLRWYIEQGVDETIGNEPISAFEADLPQGGEAKSAPSTPSKPKVPVAKAPLQPIEAIIDRAQASAMAAETLPDLKAAIEAFEGCSLKNTAMNTVFSDGAPDADLMLVGEAPGAEEDRQGRPFVGVSGQLLDRMLLAIGHDRQSSYISNILPWRPPGNRNPTPQEIRICLPFIRRHIELVKPKVVLLVGGVSAQSLLNTSEGITRIRGTWVELDVGSFKVPALPTFHPAYLLRQPGAKKRAWQDFLAARDRLAATP